MVEPSTQRFLVVDDHDSVREETCRVLKTGYPDAEISTASHAGEVDVLVQEITPDLVVMDLSMPEWVGGQARTEIGLNLLRSLLPKYPTLPIVVQSTHVKTLVRLKSIIDRHPAGFTIADKSLSSGQMLIKVDWALQGLLYTPADMRLGLDVKPEWLKLLRLAFINGLSDPAIAQQMTVTEQTVYRYWTRVQDALSIYPEAGINDVRRQTYDKARQMGLLD